MSDDALDALRREIAEAKEKANRALEAVQARSAAERFVSQHPEFDATPSNAKILVDEMQERNLDLTSVESYETVFNDPAVRGKLTTAPEEPPKVADEQPPKRGRLTADDRAFLEAAERMPSSEFRRKLQDRAFVDRYNKLVPPQKVGS